MVGYVEWSGKTRARVEEQHRVAEQHGDAHGEEDGKQPMARGGSSMALEGEAQRVSLGEPGGLSGTFCAGASTHGLWDTAKEHTYPRNGYSKYQIMPDQPGAQR
jgi:hypothetical protein